MYAYIIRESKRIIMSKTRDVDTKELIWSTWEELLLAFAVKRHGLKDWDTVAMELQNRHRASSLPPTLFTPQICKNKYRNLRRRFTNRHDNNAGAAGGGGGSENNELPCDAQSDDSLVGGGGGCSGDGDENDSFPWLEELRKLRVAELKQEVHRYDLSIRTLQMKVKTMEEEREKNLKEEAEEGEQNDDVKKPDLDEEVKQERSENDKNDDKGTPEEDAAGKSVSGDNDENMSFNESNSTENRRAGLKAEPENELAEVKPESELKPGGGEEVSCNDSSASQERGKGGGDSGELRDSVGEDESKEGTKESSDVQSSASLLTRKRKRRGGADGGGGGGGGGGGDGAAVLSPATAPIKREGGEGDAVKSEPLAAELLDKIRSHKHGSVFERRLESQKTEKYKSTIRQHVDLETVQARIDAGSYSSCTTQFYADLLLLFTNAIVFFPKSSPESLAAMELRQLVMKEFNFKDNNSSDPSPEPAFVKPKPKPELERSDSLLAQHKSTNPIIVSRKRSSISAKASSSSANNVEKQQRVDDKPVINSKTPIKSPLTTSNEEEDSVKLKIKEKPVTTGVRSMRRSSKGRPNISKPQPTPNSSNNKSSSSHQPSSKDKGDKGEAAKGDKKKSETTASTKKSGAADFLKRMKKNSPAKGTLVAALKSSRESSSSKGGKKDQPKKKQDERKDGPVRRSGGGGGGGRKQAKEEHSSSKRNAGRPPKKGKDVVVSGGKRGRESVEVEGSSKRPKKRSR